MAPVMARYQSKASDQDPLEIIVCLKLSENLYRAPTCWKFAVVLDITSICLIYNKILLFQMVVHDVTTELMNSQQK